LVVTPLAGVTAVRQVTVGGFEIGQIDAIAFAPYRSLHRDQVGERADRGFDAVNETSVRAGQKLCETDGSSALGEQVEIAVRRRQVNRPIPGNAAFWDWIKVRMRSTLPGSGSNTASTSRVARTTPWRISAIPPISTYRTPAPLRSSRIRPKLVTERLLQARSPARSGRCPRRAVRRDREQRPG